MICLAAMLVLTTFTLMPTKSTRAQATPVSVSAADICAPDSGTPADATPQSDPATPAAPIDVATLDFDLLFLDAMIPHHRVLLAMATVVRDRSNRLESQQMADVILDVQQRELDEMVSSRAEWYGDVPILTAKQLVDGMNVKLSDSPGVGGVAGLEEMAPEHLAQHLADLCGTQEGIDLALIDAIVPMHSSSVILAQAAIDRANHPEIKALGREMVADQQAEIDQVLLWRTEWYANEPFPDHHEGG